MQVTEQRRLKHRTRQCVLTDWGSVVIVNIFNGKTEKIEKDAGSITVFHWSSKVMLPVNSGHLMDSLFTEWGLKGCSLQLSSEIIRNNLLGDSFWLEV